jgi:hypothetical protein
VKRGIEGVSVQLATEAQGYDDVVNGIFGIDLREKPESLLRTGERQILRRRSGSCRNLRRGRVPEECKNLRLALRELSLDLGSHRSLGSIADQSIPVDRKNNAKGAKVGQKLDQ